MASVIANRKRAGYSAAARQPRMGPAPFASFEQDLSDEQDSPPGDGALPDRLPGIQEDCTSAGATESSVIVPPTSVHVTSSVSTSICVPGGTVQLQMPSTPRIDISRASSSSHHEEEGDSSRGSTPERELFAGQGGLGFKEDGAADLRSSTEELDFHEDATERERRRERLQRRKERGRGSMQPVFKYELEAQSEKERKDSACSLPVSGRTSRLSSVGSAASGASSGASALSVGSRAMSAVSAATSRSPSPHRMLLETSFCGNKPIPTQSIDLDSPCKHETESLEKVLLSRQTDPTKVVIAVECTPTEPSFVTPITVSPLSVKPSSLNLTESGSKTVQTFPAVVHHEPSNNITSNIRNNNNSIAIKHKKQHVVTEVIQVTRVHASGSNSIVDDVISDSIVVVESEVVPGGSQASSSARTSKVSTAISPKPPRHHPGSAGNELATTVLNKAGVTAEETRSVLDKRSTTTPSPSTSRKSSLSHLFRRTEHSPASDLKSPDSPTAKRKTFAAKLKEASDGLRDRSRSRSKSRERSQTAMTVAGSQHNTSTATTSSTSSNDSSTHTSNKSKKEHKTKSMFSSLFKKKTKRSGSIGSSDLEIQSPQDSTPSANLSPEETTTRNTTKLSDAIGNVQFTFANEAMTHPHTHSIGAQPIVERTHSEDREEKALHVDSFNTPAGPEVAAFTVLQSVVGTQSGASELTSSDGVEENPVMAESPCALPMQRLDAPEHADSSDSEMDGSRDEMIMHGTRHGPPPSAEIDHERKGLVGQDSFEDELPYIPTTLPQERSVAVPILPVRQRLGPADICAIERPRSTTPINPANLEEFVLSGPPGATPSSESERLRISLPREDSLTSSSKPLKSPRRAATAQSWTEFAEKGLQGVGEGRRSSVKSPVSPPPLPPRTSPPNQAITPPAVPAKSWINFEDIPERRKAPKKIQTLPGRGASITERETKSAAGVTFNYVKPEDCSCSDSVVSLDAFELVSDSGTAMPNRCECHGGQQHSEANRRSSKNEGIPGKHGQAIEMRQQKGHQTKVDVVETSTIDRSSVLSDSSYDFAANPYMQPGTSGGLKPNMKPFGMDLDVHSNRSSVVSQDECGSPESPTPANVAAPLYPYKMIAPV